MYEPRWLWTEPVPSHTHLVLQVDFGVHHGAEACRGFAPSADAQLGEQVVHMVFDRVDRNAELIGDITVR